MRDRTRRRLARVTSATRRPNAAVQEGFAYQGQPTDRLQKVRCRTHAGDRTDLILISDISMLNLNNRKSNHHEQTDDSRSRFAWQACFHSRGFQCAAEGRRGHRRHPHPRNSADAEAGHRKGRAAGAGFASGPAEGRPGSEILREARGQEARRVARQARGLRRRIALARKPKPRAKR